MNLAFLEICLKKQKNRKYNQILTAMQFKTLHQIRHLCQLRIQKSKNLLRPKSLTKSSSIKNSCYMLNFWENMHNMSWFKQISSCCLICHINDIWNENEYSKLFFHKNLSLLHGIVSTFVLVIEKFISFLVILSVLFVFNSWFFQIFIFLKFVNI